MRLLRPALPLLLLATACATPPVEKMSLEEAFGRPPPRGQALAAAGGPAGSIPSLNAVLAAFADGARRHRDEVNRGSPMPAPEVGNWVSLLGTLDSYLARPAKETDPHEVVRARLVMEAELELDARSYGEMPPDLADGVMQRLGRLATRLAQLRHVNARPARLSFAWPVEPVSVTSVFGRRLHPITREYQKHLGVDLAAGEGTPVMAAGDGVVTLAKYSDEGYGNHVEVDHGRGVMTRYSHLSAILVEPGLKVKQGDIIGHVGRTGLATGPHLHFEIWRDGEALDPLEELPSPPAEPDSTPMATR